MPVARRSATASVTFAADTKPVAASASPSAIAHNDEGDTKKRSDHSCCSHHHKPKDLSKYDRNTVLIGILVFATYILCKSLPKPSFLQTTGVANSHKNWRMVDESPKSREGNKDKSRGNLLRDSSSRTKIGFPMEPPPVPAPHNHLNLHTRNGTLVTLVHIGKTGGSALRELIDHATEYCKVNHVHTPNHPLPPAEGSLFTDFHKHEKTTLQKHMCALARITNRNTGLIHLDRNLPKTLTEDHFLIPLRNPVDRLVSWFYYERHFQTVAQTRYSKALNELIHPSRCGFRTADEVFLGKVDPQSKQQQINSTTLSEQQQGEQVHWISGNASLPAVVTPEYCFQLSRECLSGSIPCYGHNFFNYEYYLEDILVRILRGVAASKPANGALPSDRHTLAQQLVDAQRIPRVDVLRTEHSWDDLNRTLLEWTGLPMTPDMDFFYRTRKPFDVDTGIATRDQPLSASAAKSLCQSICPELVTYLKILKYATNLSSKETARSQEELEATCGFSIDEVCGTAFVYRNVREAKKSKLCEPHVHQRSAESGGPRRRRLAYLREQDDLPPC